MATVNIEHFRKELRGQARRYKGLAYGSASNKFNAAQRKLIDDFNNHPVTKELRDGPEAINESKTLGGYGNLFSFIGFDAGTNVVEPVERHLKAAKLSPTPRIRFEPNAIIYKFPVENEPTLEQIAQDTPMPLWESGRSWVTAIERGISGLGYYLFKRFRSLPNSHSGPALQVEGKVFRGGRYRPVSYLSAILNRFRERLS